MLQILKQNKKIEKLVKLLEFVSADEWIKSIHLIFVVVE